MRYAGLPQPLPLSISTLPRPLGLVFVRSTVNEVHINGAMVGRQGDNMIIHEHVMRVMMRTKQPPCQTDIDLLRDYAQTRKQCENKRILSKSYNGPGKFVFP